MTIQQLKGQTTTTVSVAAPLVGVSERTLRELIRKDQVPFARKLGRRTVILVEPLLEWLGAK